MQAKIWNYSQWIAETNPATIKTLFDRVLRESGFRILNESEHHFYPQGYTGLWLLSESHFAVHTFPEFQKSYVELASCNLEYYIKFVELMKNYE
ncbi:MAG: S-adenosylmethionine decarboxylase [Prevotellaceae bacterium]|jgi:S-adenosylmethionine/arginine decarboxylase-like enzyme|nr:S-adenosylmethionine decarboxylase [Prevotellaceae bacterium]